jgi:hypothetical protein
MLYSFGDSFTYGYNFFDRADRENLLYTTILSNKLGLPYKNLSLPGSSNWRTARIIQSINFKKDDIVLILWSSVTRFELGVNKNRKFKPPHDNNFSIAGDLIEIDTYNKHMITKRFFPQLTQSTSDHETRIINEIIFNSFSNDCWWEEMFKVMYTSVVYRLLTCGCKWIMFNGWEVQSNTLKEIDPRYVFPNKTMSEIIQAEKFQYWDQEQHKLVANVLYQSLQRLYENNLGV